MKCIGKSQYKEAGADREMWFRKKLSRKKVPGIGVLFWFNWQDISDSGDRMYGRYVYKHLLPYFSPARHDLYSTGLCYFFDGHFLPERNVKIPHSGPEQARVLEQVRRTGADLFYVVAIYKRGGRVSFEEVDKALRKEGVRGYTGMTSCPKLNFRKFDVLTGKMMLPYAFAIRAGGVIEKESFTYASDKELQSMGFRTLL